TSAFLTQDLETHCDSCPLDCKVYVGNLGNNGNKTELERAFGYYGPLRSVWVARNPPGFAFVEFEDPRDAADAVRELEERDHCPGREITSRPDLSLGLVADLGQMKGNRRPVCKRSGVQEITSFDRSMYRKFKFCLRLHKLGTFFKCFSCSHLFVCWNSDTKV
uniref:RRM domain-containing protein n=1 Tax=Bos indicus x Bos taurus TaxID=30522 RepID=A0A4W2HPZ3_BOBOX